MLLIKSGIKVYHCCPDSQVFHEFISWKYVRM